MSSPKYGRALPNGLMGAIATGQAYPGSQNCSPCQAKRDRLARANAGMAGTDPSCNGPNCQMVAMRAPGSYQPPPVEMREAALRDQPMTYLPPTAKQQLGWAPQARPMTPLEARIALFLAQDRVVALATKESAENLSDRMQRAPKSEQAEEAIIMEQQQGALPQDLPSVIVDPEVFVGVMKVELVEREAPAPKMAPLTPLAAGAVRPSGASSTVAIVPSTPSTSATALPGVSFGGTTIPHVTDPALELARRASIDANRLATYGAFPESGTVAEQEAYWTRAIAIASSAYGSPINECSVGLPAVFETVAARTAWMYSPLHETCPVPPMRYAGLAPPPIEVSPGDAFDPATRCSATPPESFESIAKRAQWIAEHSGSACLALALTTPIIPLGDATGCAATPPATFADETARATWIALNAGDACLAAAQAVPLATSGGGGGGGGRTLSNTSETTPVSMLTIGLLVGAGVLVALAIAIAAVFGARAAKKQQQGAAT